MEQPNAERPGPEGSASSGQALRLAASAAPLLSDPRVAAVARCVVALPPGPEAIAGLAAIDVARLAAADRMRVAVAWQAAANWLSARYHLAVAAAAGPLTRSAATANGDGNSLTGDEVDDAVCAEIGAALHLSPLMAAELVARARASATHLAPITERMLGGDFGEAHLRRAEDVTAHTSATAARAACEAVAASAPRCTPAQLRGRLQREVAKQDPEVLGRRAKASRRDRGASLWADPDLQGRIEVHGHWSHLSRAYAQFGDWAHERKRQLRELRRAYPDARLCCPPAIRAALAHAVPAGVSGGGVSGSGVSGSGVSGSGAFDREAAARSGGEGPQLPRADGPACQWCGAVGEHFPTVAQLRADAIVEAAELLAQAMALQDGAEVPVLTPGRGRRWSHAVVVVDLPTALGLAQEPGWVPGYGHIPASLARELACGASHWQRFLLDEDGALLSTGRFTYRPSDRLRELVTARDLTCTFPGCHRPATEADLDHRVNFDGTNTTAANLHPLCRTHHRLKTNAGWSVRRDAEGRDVWVSPLGLTCCEPPRHPWKSSGGSESPGGPEPSGGPGLSGGSASSGGSEPSGGPESSGGREPPG